MNSKIAYSLESTWKQKIEIKTWTNKVVEELFFIKILGFLMHTHFNVDIISMHTIITFSPKKILKISLLWGIGSGKINKKSTKILKGFTVLKWFLKFNKLFIEINKRAEKQLTWTWTETILRKWAHLKKKKIFEYQINQKILLKYN